MVGVCWTPGTPALTSDCSPLPQVDGDSALLTDARFLWAREVSGPLAVCQLARGGGALVMVGKDEGADREPSEREH